MVCVSDNCAELWPSTEVALWTCMYVCTSMYNCLHDVYVMYSIQHKVELYDVRSVSNC